MDVTIVPYTEIVELDKKESERVKQSGVILDGITANVDVKAKKKHAGGEGEAMVTVDEVVGFVKDFMKEMAGKYAVLDRPPLPHDPPKSENGSSKQEEAKSESKAN